MGFGAILYWVTTAAGLAALGGGFLGRRHPAGDSLAVFRAELAAAGVVWCALGWAAGLAPWWLALLPTAALASVLTARLRRERAGPLTLYQKNMSFRMQDVAALAADIRAVAPDFLTLQEVTPSNARLLEAVADILPHSHRCRFEHVGEVAVASRWPIRPGSRRSTHGMAAIQVDGPEGPLWLVSIHLHWPWPDRQPVQQSRIRAVLAGLAGPVVLAGDCNMVRWSWSVRSLARTIGAEPGGRARPSFRLKGTTSLAIDQVLVPAGRRGASELRGLFGSDHAGLVVRF